MNTARSGTLSRINVKAATNGRFDEGELVAKSVAELTPAAVSKVYYQGEQKRTAERRVQSPLQAARRSSAPISRARNVAVHAMKAAFGSLRPRGQDVAETGMTRKPSPPYCRMEKASSISSLRNPKSSSFAQPISSTSIRHGEYEHNTYDS
jgi:hypothetical protein